MFAHERQQLHRSFRRDHVAARESGAIVENERFRTDTHRFQKRLDAFQAELFRSFSETRSRGRWWCYFTERAQDELGVEILTRLQRLRGNQAERRRLDGGDLILKWSRRSVGARDWHSAD